MLKIGVLGASKIAPLAVIAPAKGRADVSIAAIAARDPARAQSFASTHGIPKVYDSYAGLLGDPDIDLVYNGLPPAHHLEWTLAALAAGKHVLLEKPSAMAASETAQMVAAARQSGRRLIEAFHYRYHPMFGRILNIVREGRLGPLRTASAVFEVPIPRSPDEIRWDMSLGGGALMDLGCYPVHWLRSVAGGEPTVLAAERETEDGVDVATAAELTFPGGLKASLSCSMRPSSGQPMATLTLEGRDGRLTALNPLAPQFGHMLTWTSGGAAPVTEAFDKRPTYDFQLDAVVDAIKTGRNVPTEGDDMIHTMAAIDAIAKAL